jgi:hypothetical protein
MPYLVAAAFNADPLPSVPLATDITVSGGQTNALAMPSPAVAAEPRPEACRVRRPTPGSDGAQGGRETASGPLTFPDMTEVAAALEA